MYSFYGGRPGNSFIIIKNFPTVQDMVDDFKKGPNYTDVHYDEYVIINTQDKNSEDNGKIYRRGYEYTNSQGGAEYIGTIVGPAGGSPEVQMTTEAEVEQKYQQYKDNQGFDKRFSNGSYTLTNHSLVPGKQGNDFHDEISWHCCSLRDAETKTNTIAYIGFTFPYPIIDFTLKKVDPYVDIAANRIDDGSHPFYEKWQLDIPNGIKGDSFKNLQVITADKNDGVEPYGDNKQREDRENHRQILIYEYHNYDNSEKGESKKIYLGDYNMIENISLQEDGSIRITYLHDGPIVINPDTKIKWVKDMTLSNEGLLQTQWNDNNIEQINSTPIRWIDDISFNKQTGEVTVKYNTLIEQDTDSGSQIVNETEKFYLNSIRNIEVDSQTNKIKVNFTNALPQESNLFGWIETVDIDQEGNITTTLSTGRKITSQNGLQLRWIDSATLNNDTGLFSLKWNDNKNPQILNENNPIKWIKDIEKQGTNLVITYNLKDSNNNNNPVIDIFENFFKRPISINLNADKKIEVQWEGDQEPQIITSNPLTSIDGVAVDGSGNFLMHFDPPASTDNITFNERDQWRWIGTFGTELFNLNEDSATINNGYHASGIISNGMLTFTASPTQLISKLVIDANIMRGKIKVYRNEAEVTPENGLNLNEERISKTVETGLFGITFNILDDTQDLSTHNFSVYEESFTKPIPVLVQVVDPILLNFSLNERPATAQIDWQERLNQIENSIDTLNLPQMKIYLPFKGTNQLDPDYSNFKTKGDCFIVSCGQTTILVDASNKGFIENVIPKIQQAIDNNQITPISHVIVSHYHIDHVGGFQTLLNPENVQHLFKNNCKFFLPTLPTQNQFIDGTEEEMDKYSRIKEQHDNLISWINAIKQSTSGNLNMYFKNEDLITYPVEEQTFVFDAINNPHFSVRFLNCSSKFSHYYNVTSYNEKINQGTRYNNFSLVTEFKHGDITFLSPGDIEPAAQAQIANSITKTPDIYKLEHHTYTNHTDPNYLEKINPKVAFVIGRNDTNLNEYSSSETMQHLINATDAIIIGENIDRDDAYIISDGINIRVMGEGITKKGLVLASPGQKITYDFDKAVNNILVSLDNYKIPGTYYATGGTMSWTNNGQTVTQTIANAPFNIYFKLIVCSIFDAGSTTSANNCVQIAISRNGKIATRYYYNSEWSNWNYMVQFPNDSRWINILESNNSRWSKILESDNSDWANIINNNIHPFLTQANPKLEGNFVVNGFLNDDKNMVYCTIHFQNPIDTSKFSITVRGVNYKVRQNGKYLAGSDNSWGQADPVQDTATADKQVNGWMTPFGYSLQIYHGSWTTSGGKKKFTKSAYPNSPTGNAEVSIEFGSLSFNIQPK